MLLSKKPIFRFLIAGSATVAVDAIAYSALLSAGLSIDAAKGMGLVFATIFAYLVNRNWTFRAGNGGIGQFGLFLVLYMGAIALNVAVNRLAVDQFGTLPQQLAIAWFLATASSSTLNYIGMRWIVFRQPAVP